MDPIYNDFGFGGGVSMTDTGLNTSMAADALFKALSAGDSANPGAMGTGGNTLQFESLESQLVLAIAERPEDFKLMALQPKNGVGSTVHQYTQAKDSGSFEGVNTAELGAPIESNSEYARITRNIKYFQTKREASLQANLLNPIVGSVAAEAQEEKMGTHVLLKATESVCFHGNEAVVPNQPNGYPQQIRNEAPGNVFDMAGKRITDAGGETTFEEAIRGVSELGGEISDAFFPYVLAQDWQNLLKDRYRYNEGTSKAGSQLTTFQSMYGKDIWISGRAGIDKMYKVKGVPVASTLSTIRPNAPTFTLTAQAKTGGTGFVVANAGTYRYSVYAIDATGLISLSAAPANVAVASGEEVKIVVTPAGSQPGTGFIVCRGKKDVTTGLDIREMYKGAFPATPAATDSLDQNDELPGTAEMLLMTSDLVQDTYQWDSFCELKRFNLGATRASIPFLVLWYGTPDMKIANFNAVIKNVGHVDINGWF